MCEINAIQFKAGKQARLIREFLNSESLFLYPKEKNNHAQLCSCLDYIQDLDGGLFGIFLDKPNQNLISIIGTMQALIVKHDAVKNLFKSLDVERKGIAKLKDIRKLRHILAGHPTEQGHRSSFQPCSMQCRHKDRLNSSVELKYCQISIESFKYPEPIVKYSVYTYTENNKEHKGINDLVSNQDFFELNLLEVAKQQDDILTGELAKLHQKLINKENQRRGQYKKSFLDRIIGQLSEAHHLLDGIEANSVENLEKIETMLKSLSNVRDGALYLLSYEPAKEELFSSISRLKDIYTHGCAICGAVDLLIFADVLSIECKYCVGLNHKLNYLVMKVLENADITSKDMGEDHLLFSLGALKDGIEENRSHYSGAQEIINLIIRLEKAVICDFMQVSRDDASIYIKYLKSKLEELLRAADDIYSTLSQPVKKLCEKL